MDNLRGDIQFCPQADSGHGGNIYRLARILGVEEHRIVDFSASVNPIGLPGSVVEAIKNRLKSLQHYPDPEMLILKDTISHYIAVEPAQIICGNGSTELIYLIVRSLSPERVLIPQPTFSEYERAVRVSVPARKVRVSYFFLPPGHFELDIEGFMKALKGHDMAFLCNPNNPTGWTLKKEAVKAIADEAKKQKCFLVVDEAFIDFIPENSIVQETGHNEYLIVLRSLTKFYAMAGLRFGYGVFHPSVTDRIMCFKEPWTVNTLAQIAAVEALRDKDYQVRTMKLIAEEKRYLETAFRQLGIEYIPSDVNFYLLRLQNAIGVTEYLAKKGILVRDCSNFVGLDSGYIRIAVRDRKDNLLLLEQLQRFLRG